jgi:recombination protein RecT
MSKDLAVINPKGFMLEFQSRTEDTLKSFLNNDKAVMKFFSSMRMCFSANPKLKDCTKESLFNVFLQCAELELYPSTTSGECHVIPYKDKASFQIGYQGMVTLAYRAGIKRISSEVIYKNDAFDYSLGTAPFINHKADIFNDDRGEPIGVYAVALLDNGASLYQLMSKSDIEKIREKSQAYQYEKKKGDKNSPWFPENDPLLWMWKKTCIKQLYKLLPKSSDMQKAAEMDTKADVEYVNPASPQMIEMQNASDNDIAAFVNEAHEFLKETHEISEGKDRDTMITSAVKDCTNGKTSMKGITTDQLDAIKRLLFNGEAPDGD